MSTSSIQQLYAGKRIDDILPGINTLLFCDETKFYRNNGDADDTIFYFGVAVRKKDVPDFNRSWQAILSKYRFGGKVFHASKIFKETRPRERLMEELANFFISNKIHCFCVKYRKNDLYDLTQLLSYLNKDNILDFNDAEFQALFYYLLILNTELRDKRPTLLKREIIAFFDRNVYGKEDMESFQFANEQFVLNAMTFTEKSRVGLLALPDFVGYMFHKSKQSFNKAELGDPALETSPLSICCYYSLLRIRESNLFHFLDYDTDAIAIMIEALAGNSKQTVL